MNDVQNQHFRIMSMVSRYLLDRMRHNFRMSHGWIWVDYAKTNLDFILWMPVASTIMLINGIVKEQHSEYLSG